MIYLVAFFAGLVIGWFLGSSPRQGDIQSLADDDEDDEEKEHWDTRYSE